MSFLGVGAGEALLIFILTLLLVGPRRFPEIMRQAGRWYKIARGFTTEVMRDVRDAVDEIEQEVSAEAELESVRDLADVGKELEHDLTEAGREAETIGRTTQEAARTAEGQAREVETATQGEGRASGTTRASGSTGRRSSRLLRHTRGNPGSRRTENAGAKEPGDAAETAEDTSDPGGASRESENGAGPPATTPPVERRQPTVNETVSEEDPFQALEARQKAARGTKGVDPADEAGAR